MLRLTKGVANDIPFVMVDSDGAVVTGLGSGFSPFVRKEAGAFVAGGGTNSELGNGWYNYRATAAECDTAGSLALRVTGAGAVQQNLVMTVATDVADAVWDEVLTAATHNVATSAGRRLRVIGSLVVREETAQGPGTGTNQIQLDSGASAVDGSYDPCLIVLVGGAGLGQSRMIMEYDGDTKTATVDRDWKVAPDETTEFQILAHPGREHVNEGLARGGTSTTITLNTLACSHDDEYNGQVIFIRSGGGSDQARRVIDYDGTTKIATVDSAWDVIPGTTSGYVMLPTAATPNDYLGQKVWGYATRTLTQSAASVVAAVSGDAITVTKATSWSISITGLGSLAGRTKLWFTVKIRTTDADSEAMLQIEETEGLLYVRGASGTAGNASLTVDDEDAGNVTIVVIAAEAAQFAVMDNLFYDIKQLAGTVSQVSEGRMNINDVVTLAID